MLVRIVLAMVLMDTVRLQAVVLHLDIMCAMALKLPRCGSEPPEPVLNLNRTVGSGAVRVRFSWADGGCGSRFGGWVFLANRREPVRTVTAPDNIT